MGLETHSTTIDGHRYEMTLLGATPGYRLFYRLVKMFGPGIGHIIDAAERPGGIGALDLSSDAAAAGLRQLTGSLGQDDLDHLIAELRKQTTLEVGDGKQVPLASVFDAHFRGRLGAMVRWLWWGLQVQFSDFFGVFADMMPPSEGGGSPAATERH